MLLEIKRVTKDDIAMVALLFDAYRRFYQQPSNLPAAFEFLDQRISNNESVIFLATFKNEAVGFAQLYPIFSSVSLRNAWLLNDLYVAEHARKQGIGEALLQQAKQFGIETKAKYIQLQTAADKLHRTVLCMKKMAG